MQLFKIVAIATFSLIACSSGTTTETPANEGIVDGGGGIGGEGGVGGDSDGGSGGEGGATGCKSTAECPPKTQFCIDPACVDGACIDTLKPVDTPCEEGDIKGVCRGDGSCKPPQ